MMNNIRIVLCVFVLLLIACGGQQKGKSDGKAQYKTMRVSKSDQTLVSPYTARLTGRQIVEVRPQVSGNITKICINEGDQVTKGQTLFIIDQVPYQAALEVAEANVKTVEAKLATAQMEYESSKTLKAGQVISDYEVQVKLHALNEAKAKGMKTLAILGRDGGRLAGLADVEIIIKGTDSGRIQEAHQLLMHILLDGVDRRFV